MLDIAGVTEFGAVARQARLADAELIPSMKRQIAKVGKPARKHVEAAIEAKMPKRGGYAATLVKAIRVRVKTDTGFTTAGVTLVTYADGQQRRRDVPALNRGRLRKKVYGNPRVWVTQSVPAGFWDDAMDATSNDAHQRVREVLDQTIRTLKG